MSKTRPVSLLIPLARRSLARLAVAPRRLVRRRLEGRTPFRDLFVILAPSFSRYGAPRS